MSSPRPSRWRATSRIRNSIAISWSTADGDSTWLGHASCRLPRRQCERSFGRHGAGSLSITSRSHRRVDASCLFARIRARILADELGKTWGRPVVVENRPGGGGIIGAKPSSRLRPTATRYSPPQRPRSPSFRRSWTNRRSTLIATSFRSRSSAVRAWCSPYHRASASIRSPR